VSVVIKYDLNLVATFVMQILFEAINLKNSFIFTSSCLK
jgi:hypothetical protein